MAAEDLSEDFSDFMRILRARYLQADAADFETCFGHAARTCDTFGLWKPEEDEAKRALLQDLQDEAIDLNKAIARLFHEGARNWDAKASVEEAGSPDGNVLNPDDALEAALARMLSAECPWEELSKVIEERRQQNVDQGGDDLFLACLIVFLTVRVGLPVWRA